MKSRPYRMRARADAAAATAERILDAVEGLFFEDPAGEMTLAAIARRAGVSQQTVIRRFGGRDGAEAAARERALARIEAQRGEAAPGDLPGAVAVLVAHYEQEGEAALRMLAQESRSPRLAEIVENGRRLHAAWCERVFAPALAPLRGTRRARRLAQLIAVCDVHTWQLLRHDRRLSRRQTELALLEMLDPLTQEP